MSERWLIAVNGKTEAIYINALRQLFRSSAVEVKNFANDPLSQVVAAEKFAKLQATKFRRVYVVFDTDHFDPALALSKIQELNDSGANKRKTPGAEWIAIVNSPCFEFWYYLHFDYTCAAFGGQTPCRDLQSQFAKVFLGYSKVDAKTAKELVESGKLNTACDNARKLNAHPSSTKAGMWKLVEALRDR
jgi:hypothetical protein